MRNGSEGRVALWRAGVLDPDEALDVAERVQGSPDAPVEASGDESAWRVPPHWLDRLRRAAADGTRHSQLGRTELVEPLTPRERDVLRFLASRLTVHEIADELYLSVNTLKFHLKAIYRKLGVNSRAEAAEAARRMSATRPTS